MNRTLRIPDDLAKRIEALAKQNKRSFNAEVLMALEQYANQRNYPDVQFGANTEQKSNATLKEAEE